MSWKSALALGLCAFTIIATACGSDETNTANNTANNTTTPITADEYLTQFPDLLIESICNAVFSCPEKQPTTFLQSVGRFATKADCVANLASTLWIGGTKFKTEHEALEAGRIEFDSQRATQCITDLKKDLTQCNSVEKLLSSTPVYCANVFIPTLQENSPCNARNQCISNICMPTPHGECFGRCAPAIELAKEGEVCNNKPCDDNLACVLKPEGSTIQRYCTRPGSIKKGEFCDFHNSACAENLTCTREFACTDRAPLANSGEHCDNNTIACTPGLTCIDLKLDPSADTDIATGTCGLPKPAGALCHMTTECQPGLYCSGSLHFPGTCTAPRTVDQICEGDPECAHPLVCDRYSGRCATPAPTPTCEIPTE